MLHVNVTASQTVNYNKHMAGAALVGGCSRVGTIMAATAERAEGPYPYSTCKKDCAPIDRGEWKKM